MNPYEAPQTVDRPVKEAPRKGNLSWSEIALLCAVITVTQFVMHYFREQEREKKQAEMIQQIMQQVQSPFSGP